MGEYEVIESCDLAVSRTFWTIPDENFLRITRDIGLNSHEKGLNQGCISLEWGFLIKASSMEKNMQNLNIPGPMSYSVINFVGSSSEASQCMNGLPNQAYNVCTVCM